MKYNVIVISDDATNGATVVAADGSTEFTHEIAEAVVRNRKRNFGGAGYDFKMVPVEADKFQHADAWAADLPKLHSVMQSVGKKYAAKQKRA